MGETIHSLLSDSPEIIKQLKPRLGKLDEELEYIGYWRDTGVENLWIMPGTVQPFKHFRFFLFTEFQGH